MHFATIITSALISASTFAGPIPRVPWSNETHVLNDTKYGLSWNMTGSAKVANVTEVMNATINKRDDTKLGLPWNMTRSAKVANLTDMMNVTINKRDDTKLGLQWNMTRSANVVNLTDKMNVTANKMDDTKRGLPWNMTGSANVINVTEVMNDTISMEARKTGPVTVTTHKGLNSAYGYTLAPPKHSRRSVFSILECLFFDQAC
ncbi:hypothetical protein MMC12_007900 [Toensbergia leucococca]|nr:hypothetical protein [Toensbergia leucococca]